MLGVVGSGDAAWISVVGSGDGALISVRVGGGGSTHILEWIIAFINKEVMALFNIL